MKRRRHSPEQIIAKQRDAYLWPGVSYLHVICTLGLILARP